MCSYQLDIINQCLGEMTLAKRHPVYRVGNGVLARYFIKLPDDLDIGRRVDGGFGLLCSPILFVVRLR